MKKTILAKSLLSVGLGGALLVSMNAAYASAFQIYEQDAAQIGDYHAGAAVNSDNSASATFYNPAALSILKDNQVTTGITFVDTDVSYSGNVQVNLFGGSRESCLHGE